MSEVRIPLILMKAKVASEFRSLYPNENYSPMENVAVIYSRVTMMQQSSQKSAANNATTLGAIYN